MQKTRRSLSNEIIKCDGFVSMSSASQALYMQLVGSCDDEGFTSSIETCKFHAHADEANVQELIKKRFIYLFENDDSRVVLIKHWRRNNYMGRGVVPSEFAERDLVYVKSNDNYTLDPKSGVPLPPRNARNNNERNARNNVQALHSNPTQSNSIQSNTTQSNPTHSNTTKQPKEDTNNQPDLSWLPPDDDELPI